MNRNRFQRHFAELCAVCSGLETEVNYLYGMSPFSARDVEFREMPATAEDIRDALTSCSRERSQGVNNLPFELYIHMPDLFGTNSSRMEKYPDL